MKWILIIGFLIFIIKTYPKWSYKKWAEDSQKYVIPFTGKRKDSH